MRIGSSTWLGIPLLVMGACAQPPKVDVEAERASLLAAEQAWSQSGGDHTGNRDAPPAAAQP